MGRHIAPPLNSAKSGSTSLQRRFPSSESVVERTRRSVRTGRRACICGQAV